MNFVRAPYSSTAWSCCVNFTLNLPLEIRLLIVFVLGVLIGTQVNHFVYRLAHHRRNIGPWLPRDVQAPPRHWYDWLPIFGWCTLSREAKVHGAGFWLRPLMIEILMGVGLALLYWWEVDIGGLTPATVNVWAAPPIHLPPQGPFITHAQFLVHTILIALMAVATFIDVDEKLIPDEVTVYGALVGLTLAAALPISRLPDWNAFDPTVGWNDATRLYLTSSNLWAGWLDGPRGLAIGLGCYVAWWLAIIPFTRTLRHGFAQGVRYMLASFRRRIWPRAHRPHEGWRYYPVILIAGLAVAVVVWWLSHAGKIDAGHWRSLLSSLVGMAAGGAIVWAVRIIGTRALGQEAMGFGDVTLVAMIGAFLGWQPCLMLFFIAPFIGVLIALAQLIVTRRTEIWYGPFLCAGALLTIVFWATLWEGWGRPLFSMGWLVPAILSILLVIMGAMLTIWRFIKERFIFRDEAE